MSVPKPAASSVLATERLRGLKRLLPLPCANTTRPAAALRDAQVGLELDARVSQDSNGAPDRVRPRERQAQIMGRRSNRAVCARPASELAGRDPLLGRSVLAPPRSRTRQRGAGVPAFAS